MANANVSLRSHTYTSFYRCVGEQKPRRDITLQQSWRLYRKMKMFLYLCRRLPPTNVSRQQIFIVCDEQHPKLQQLPFTANVDIHCHVILRKPKEASFHVKKKTNFFIHAKSQNQATTHASTTLCLLVSLILSMTIILFKHVQKISIRHACNTLMTLYETG